MAETIKYISLENLQLYDSLLKDKMDAADAKSLKTVALSEDGKKLLFYRVSEPVGSTSPAYEIELPEFDPSGLVAKVVTAITGNVPVFEAGGGIKDSGIAIDDLANKDYVDTKVAEGVAGAMALSKVIVTEVPKASAAKDNVIYMLKNTTAAGADKYEEYMLINGEVVMIGDTSTDLSNYFTKEQAQAIVDAAKQEAINTAATDATTKADQALADAKAYTDAEVKKVSDVAKANSDSITAIQGDITTIQGDITTINNTLSTHSTKIASLESSVNAIGTASEADIRALFA